MTFSDTRKLNQIKDSVRALYTQAYSVQNPSTKTIKKVSPSADLRTKKGWAHIESELDMVVERKTITARVHAEDEPQAQTGDDIFDFYGAPIDIYTRAEAVQDGIQFCLSDEFAQEAKEAGMSWPVYCDASFHLHMFDEPCTAPAEHNDRTGVAWDIFGQLRRAIKASTGNTQKIEVVVVVTGSKLEPAYHSDRMPHYYFTAEIQGHDYDKAEPCLMLQLVEHQKAHHQAKRTTRRHLRLVA